MIRYFFSLLLCLPFLVFADYEDFEEEEEDIIEDVSWVYEDHSTQEEWEEEPEEEEDSGEDLLVSHDVLEEDPPEELFPKLYNTAPLDLCLDHLKASNIPCSDELLNLPDLHLIPFGDRECDHVRCMSCHQLVERDVLQDDEGVIHLGYLCPCLSRWSERDGYYIQLEDKVEINFDEEEEIASDIPRHYWKGCLGKTIPNLYFESYAQQFSPFFKEHLNYVKDNPQCSCFWPHIVGDACMISNQVYATLADLLENSLLDSLVSESNNRTFFPFLGESSHYGILTGLFPHAFFYSHYRQILLKMGEWADSYDVKGGEAQEILNSLYQLIQTIQPSFLQLYSKCLNAHPHPKIHYERGMLLFHQGNTLESLEDIQAFLSSYPKSSQLHFQKGEIYAELGLYEDAVGALSEAISQDPNNKQAYFARAAAYFELGKFEVSLQDYLASSNHSQPIPMDAKEMLSFASGLSQGILQSVAEFGPSLLSSLQGLGNGLWAFAAEPIPVSLHLVESLSSCIEYIRENTSAEALESLVPELRTLCSRWDQLPSNQKGKLIGETIGKYGIDIFSGGALVKGIALFRDLKKANTAMTLATMASSSKNRTLIESQALLHAQARQHFLKNANLQIHAGKQGKHIPGHNNFIPTENPSILEHPDPQRLVNAFAGTGIKNSPAAPGLPGYKEIVDCREFVGYVVDRTTGEKFPTTWIKIHYAKDGVHIVPTKHRG